MDAVGTAIRSVISAIAAQVSAGVQLVISYLIDLALLLFSWLPDHAPIAWPDPSEWGLLFRPLGVFARFIDLPILFVTLTLMLGWTICILLYAAYRAVLGLIPMFK
jgi:hypothetical protein